MQLELFEKSYLPLIEAKLKEVLTFPASPQEKLFAAARYSVLGGGKRLRPMLTLASAISFGGNTEIALIPACALELIHCYSLIHDDLPCMDDDDFRRGKPSLHKHTDEGTAVLVGDFLLTYAFDLLAHAQRDLHSKKTAELFSCALLFGAIAAGSSDEELESCRKIGLKLGLAFQILDDILDITSSEEKHGKKISSDQTNGKSTFITHFGLNGAKEEVAKLTCEIESALNTFGHEKPLMADYTLRMIR
jgi:geranylgeranyl diphosphate synthase type II